MKFKKVVYPNTFTTISGSWNWFIIRMKKGSGIGGLLRNKENNKIKLSIKVDKVKKKNKQDKIKKNKSNNAGNIDRHVRSKNRII